MKLIFVRHGQTDENQAHVYLGHTDAPLNNEGHQQIIQFSEKFRHQRQEIFLDIETGMSMDAFSSSARDTSRNKITASGKDAGMRSVSRVAADTISSIHSVTTTNTSTGLDTITAIYSSDLTRAMQTAQIIRRQLAIPITIQSEFALRELNFGQWECLTYKQIYEQEPEQLTSWIDQPFTTAPPKGETLTELGQRFDTWFTKILQQTSQNDTIIIVTHGGPIRWFISKWLNKESNQFWQVNGLKHGSGLVVEYNKETQQFSKGKLDI